jgi:hypothetical protein
MFRSLLQSNIFIKKPIDYSLQAGKTITFSLGTTTEYRERLPQKIKGHFLWMGFICLTIDYKII